MFIHPKFVFIHFCHNGGRTVRKTLSNYLPEGQDLDIETLHWHKPIRVFYTKDYKGKSMDLCGKLGNRATLGIVRNPWDWYVSLWWRQSGHGRKFSQNSPKPFPNNFEFFLTNFLDKEYNRKSQSDLSCQFCVPGDPSAYLPKEKWLSENNFGWFTYKYLYFFYQDCYEILEKKIQFSQEVFDTKCSMTDIITMEDLDYNMKRFLSKYNIDYPSWIDFNYRDGASGHPHYTTFYTKSLIDLVARKDKEIIKKYGYKFGY